MFAYKNYLACLLILITMVALGVLQQSISHVWYSTQDNIKQQNTQRATNKTTDVTSGHKTSRLEQFTTPLYNELLIARDAVLNHSRFIRYRRPCVSHSRVDHVLIQDRIAESPLNYINDVRRHIPESRVLLWNRTDAHSSVYPFYMPASTNCVYLKNKSIGKGRYLPGCTHDVSTPLVSNMDTIQIWTYVNIIPDAIVNRKGHVISGNVKLMPRSCSVNSKPDCFSADNNKQVHDEVFAISQNWGSGFFHGTLENLPRLAPFLPFLQQHPNVKIHVAANHPFLPLLGINASRIVTGSVQSKVLYMPEGTRCGTIDYFNANMLRQALQRNMVNSTSKRDNIVLIQRSHRRWFDNHDAILKMLTKYAKELRLNVHVFSDRAIPPISITVELFYRALVVVAPHGAGESNILFTQPGTVLLEGLCYDGGKINLCYQHTAQMLGLRYYGMVYNYDCRKITASDVEEVFVKYMKLLGYRSPSMQTLT